MIKLTGTVSSTGTPIDSFGNYEYDFAVKRWSGAIDTIKVHTTAQLTQGSKLALQGEVRTTNKLVNGKSKLLVWVQIKGFESVFADTQDDNYFTERGFVVKVLPTRTTPLGKTISDFLLAINREKGTAYIWCILFGESDLLTVGREISIVGRLQLRQFVNSKGENGTAYEIAVSNIFPMFAFDKFEVLGGGDCNTLTDEIKEKLTKQLEKCYALAKKYEV